MANMKIVSLIEHARQRAQTAASDQVEGLARQARTSDQVTAEEIAQLRREIAELRDQLTLLDLRDDLDALSERVEELEVDAGR